MTLSAVVIGSHDIEATRTYLIQRASAALQRKAGYVVPCETDLSKFFRLEDLITDYGRVELCNLTHKTPFVTMYRVRIVLPDTCGWCCVQIRNAFCTAMGVESFRHEILNMVIPITRETNFRMCRFCGYSEANHER